MIVHYKQYPHDSITDGSFDGIINCDKLRYIKTHDFFTQKRYYIYFVYDNEQLDFVYSDESERDEVLESILNEWSAIKNIWHTTSQSEQMENFWKREENKLSK